MRRKFDDGLYNILDDAKRRQQNIFKGNMPWWGWILIVYFGYDDILRLAYSYWLIPVILIAASYGILSAMGMGALPLKLIYPLQDLFFKQIRKKLY